MIEQIPDICADKGIQQEMRDYAKKTIEQSSVRLDEFNIQMEKILYKAVMYGLATGFRYGWKLSEAETKSYMQKNVNYYKERLRQYEEIY